MNIIHTKEELSWRCKLYIVSFDGKITKR